MGNNDFLDKQRKLQQAHFDAGVQMGRQQILDMMSLVLHDPEIMAKDTFGKDRLLKVINGIFKKLDKYKLAWKRHDETDYVRAKLDAALAEAYGESLHDSFLQRYKFASEYDYKTGRWKK